MKRLLVTIFFGATITTAYTATTMELRSDAIMDGAIFIS